MANTILLKGDLGRRYDEARAIGICSPGHLLQLDSAGKVLKHSTVGGRTNMIAQENGLLGGTIDTAYAVGDIVPYHIFHTGDMLNFRLPVAAPAVVIGDRLISNGDGTVIKAYGSGGSDLYVNTAASAAVTNTVTETAFDKSYTFAANQLRAGDIIRIRGQVIATATNSTDTLNIKLYIGGTSGTLICQTGALDVANNDIAVFDAELVVRTAGSSGTIVGSGFVTIGVPGTATTKTFALASTTINTTVAQQIVATATWSVANAGNSVRLDNLTVGSGNVTSNGSGVTIAVAAEAVDNSAGVAEAFIAGWAA